MKSGSKSNGINLNKLQDKLVMFSYFALTFSGIQRTSKVFPSANPLSGETLGFTFAIKL